MPPDPTKERSTDREAPAENPAAPRPYAPEDVERGLRHNHVAQAHAQRQISELTASLHALLETLAASGSLPVEAYEARRRLARTREHERPRSPSLPILGETPDKYALTGLPQIDCAARLPLCHARCCTLLVPLSPQDLDERIVRWDYGRPYLIARREDGFCAHSEPGTCRCTIYDSRPAPCRTYDCRSDTRIWRDFDRRVPAS